MLHPQKFTPENVEFQAKILARSGLGDDTYLPPSLQQTPPGTSMQDARWEFQQVGIWLSFARGAKQARSLWRQNLSRMSKGDMQLWHLVFKPALAVTAADSG